MATTTKKKLCWNCDGQVALTEENCSFCGVYLGPSPGTETSKRENIITPPYKIIETEVDDEDAPTSSYAPPQQETDVPLEPPKEIDETSEKSILFSLTLLSFGTLFLFFGLILALFSEEGTLTLRWSGEYWYLYLIFSIPMLFLGWKMIQKSDLRS